MPAVQLRDVSVGSPSRRRLDGVTVTFRPGVTVLLGPNGAGKSTLLGTLLGAVRPSAGEVLVDDSPASGRLAAQLPLGWVPQRAELPGGLRVAGAVGYAAWLQKVPRRQAEAAVARALELTNMSSKAGLAIGTLSGGQRQRVALACALVHDPSVLLVDEPTVGLDPAERHTFHDALRQAVERGAAVVMATHLLEDVMPVARDVVVLVDGRIRFEGTVDEFAARGDGAAAGSSPLEQAYLALVRDPVQTA